MEVAVSDSTVVDVVVVGVVVLMYIVAVDVGAVAVAVMVLAEANTEMQEQALDTREAGYEVAVRQFGVGEGLLLEALAAADQHVSR